MRHIFIIGAGRSGTKFLRDCIGCTPNVAMIPYDVGYLWRVGNQRVDHDQLTAQSLNASDKKRIRQSLSKMARTAGRGREYNCILEKSVPNSLRPALVDFVFPDCLFVHIVRNGYDVVESASRNWVKPSDHGYFLDKLRYFPIRNVPYACWYAFNKFRFGNDAPSIWGPRYEGIQLDVKSMTLEEVCAKQWVKCVEVSTKQLTAIGDSRSLEIRYEDFTRDVTCLKQILQFCQLDETDAVDYYTKHLKSDTGSKQLLPNSILRTISPIMQSTLQDKGYEFRHVNK